MVLGFFEFNQLRFKIKSSWVKRAAASFSLFLICPLVTHDSMCVCVVGGFGPSAQMTYGGGKVMIKMVDVTLSEGVGRRQEEKVRVSTLMLFFLGPVSSAVYWEFICVQLRCHSSFCVVGEGIAYKKLGETPVPADHIFLSCSSAYTSVFPLVPWPNSNLRDQ